MIPVNKPFLPPKSHYLEFIDGIWESQWLTNNGVNVVNLEKELGEYLSVDNLSFVTNGTIAIQMAIKALKISGEIITTPFSYVATTSSICWEGCTPVFVDIDKETFNIDPFLIEDSITENTSAIIATHVFGNPCNVEKIEEIAKKYNLFVIYDAAHCFATMYKGKSILSFGDISTISFHATKLFHTVEGGAVITSNKELKSKIELLRNFGHDGYDKFSGIGINGKNSELHAAMGLCNLNYIDDIINKRREDSNKYYSLLKLEPLTFQKIQEGTDYNYSYLPIVFESEEVCLTVLDRLNKVDIYPRRYFYPVLSQLDYVKPVECPIAESIASSVICLPLFYDLKEWEIELVCANIVEILASLNISRGTFEVK
jgi:dTDP-4-amino-4,6-dideoxygalactose transaminase